MPPRLSIVVPDLRSSIPNLELNQMSGTWQKWWNSTIDFHSKIGLDQFPRKNQEFDFETLASERKKVFDPPEFECLQEWPSLQLAAKTVQQLASQSHNDDGQRTSSARGNAPRAKMIADLVEELRVKRSPEDMNLTFGIVGLPVIGKWWSFPRPDFLICSHETMSDEAEFLRLVRRLVVIRN